MNTDFGDDEDEDGDDEFENEYEEDEFVLGLRNMHVQVPGVGLQAESETVRYHIYLLAGACSHAHSDRLVRCGQPLSSQGPAEGAPREGGEELAAQDEWDDGRRSERLVGQKESQKLQD